MRKSGDVARLAEAIPYARWMRIAPENGTGELLTRMRYHDDLIGNTFLPAIHGGTLGAMLEMAAIFHLLWETETETVPKIVNITVDYLRSARPVDVIACGQGDQAGPAHGQCLRRGLAGRPLQAGRHRQRPFPGDVRRRCPAVALTASRRRIGEIDAVVLGRCVAM